MKKTIHKVILIHIPIFLLMALFYIKLDIANSRLKSENIKEVTIINSSKTIEDNLNIPEKLINIPEDNWEEAELTELKNIEIPEKIIPEYKRDIEIAFLWDVMIGSRVWEAMETKWQDYVYSWTKDYLSEKDAVILNLETTVTDSEEKVNKTYTFKAKAEHLQWLSEFNENLVVNLANNHIWDYKQDWIIDTINNLDNYNIKYFWAWENKSLADQIKIITVEWVKIWLIWQTCVNPVSFWATDSSAGNSRFDKDLILQEINIAQDNSVDIIVYNMHCWTEYTNWPNALQVEYAHFAIDNWADLVIWHHPHWYQPVEIYKEKLIFYSLWDYIFDIFRGRRTQEGIIANIKISDKKIIWAEIIPTYTQSYWNTVLSDSRRKDYALNELYNISEKLWDIEWIKEGYINLVK